MIIEAVVGIAMNLFMADNATGQNLTRGILMYKKINGVNKPGLNEEVKQITKDAIIGVHQYD